MIMKHATGLAILGGTVFAGPPAAAQAYIAPPEFKQVDGNGVDLLSGAASFSVELGSIGSGAGRLSYSDYWNSGGRRTSMNGQLVRYQDDNNLQTYVSITIDDSSKLFIRMSSGAYAVVRGNYELLQESEDGQTFQYTRKNGEVVTFGVAQNQIEPSAGHCNSNTSVSPEAQCGLLMLRRSFPSGITWTYDWQASDIFVRPLSLSNNLGFKISLTHLSGVTPDITNYQDWAFVTGVNFYNLAVSASPLSSASRSRVSGAIQIVTDGGQIWRVTGSGDPDTGTFSVKTPSSSSTNFTYLPVHPFFSHPTTSAVVNGVSYSYDFYLSGNTGTTTVTDPTGVTTRVDYTRHTSKVSSAAFPLSITDGAGNVTAFETVKGYLITSVTRPEGDKDLFQYDARDNITLRTRKAKPGSGLSDITESASFPATCSEPAVCNQPASTTDANGNTTTYTYAAHGGVLTVSSPAVGGISPRKKYHYAQRNAWIKNSGGGYSEVADPVWVLTEERTCRTSTLDLAAGTCSGGSSDLLTTTYDYGPDSGPNNLLLRGKTVTAYNWPLVTCYTYDSLGRTISERTPNSMLTSCS